MRNNVSMFVLLISNIKNFIKIFQNVNAVNSLSELKDVKYYYYGTAYVAGKQWSAARRKRRDGGRDTREIENLGASASKFDCIIFKEVNNGSLK